MTTVTKPCLIAIDPGLNCSGFAVFESERLIYAASVQSDLSSSYLRAPRVAHMGWLLWKEIERHRFRAIYDILIETPQVYVRARSKGNPNDLLPLAMIAGYITSSCHVFCMPTYVLPHEWKGNLPKKIGKLNPMETRVRGHLNGTERDVLTGDLTHDAFDAIGLGLWRLGRLDGRVLAGAV